MPGLAVFLLLLSANVVSAQAAQPLTPEALQADWYKYHYPLEAMVKRLWSETHDRAAKWHDVQQRNRALKAALDERDALEDQFAAAELIFNVLFLALEARQPQDAAVRLRVNEICNISSRWWNSGIERGPKYEEETRKLEISAATEGIADKKVFDLLIESIDLRFSSSRNLLDQCRRAMGFKLRAPR